MEIVEYGILFAIGWMLAPYIIALIFMIFGTIAIPILTVLGVIADFFTPKRS